MSFIEPQKAIGTVKMARAFADAAVVVQHANTEKITPVVPAYYLYCHAIELGLKAFLIAGGGATEKHLARKIGHDLERALREACDHGLKDVVVLLPEHEEAILMMNPYYAGKRLEYVYTGYREYPEIEYLQSCAIGLLDALKPHLDSMVREHLASR